MRILIVLLLFLELLQSNIILSDKSNTELVSLGEYQDNSKLKVYKNGKIVFVDIKDLKQTDQYSTEKFLSFLDKHNLEFQLLLENKWDIRIYRKKIYIKTKKEKAYSVSDLNFYYYRGNSTGFYCAFKAKKSDVYGFITYRYKSMPHEYSMDVKVGKDIFSAALTINQHKE